MASARALADSVLEMQDDTYNIFPDGVRIDGELVDTYPVGPNATIALGLLDAYSVTGDEKYLDAAEEILIWMQSLQIDPESDNPVVAGALIFGWDAEGVLIDDTISFEHNIRAGKAFLRYWELTGDSEALAVTMDIANWAVTQMWDSEEGRFNVGASSVAGSFSMNTNVELALDVQSLGVIFLHELNKNGNYGENDDLNYMNYKSAIEWVRPYLDTVIHEGEQVSGYGKVLNGDYAAASLGGINPGSNWDNIWAEGTLAHAYAERLIGAEDQYSFLVAEMLKLYDHDSGGILHIVGENPDYYDGWPAHFPYASVASTCNFVYLTLSTPDDFNNRFYNLKPPAAEVPEDTGVLDEESIPIRKIPLSGSKATMAGLRRFFPLEYQAESRSRRARQYENIIAPSLEEHGLLGEYLFPGSKKDYDGKKILDILEEVFYAEGLSPLTKFFYIFGFRTIPILWGIIAVGFALFNIPWLFGSSFFIAFVSLVFTSSEFIYEHNTPESQDGAANVSFLIMGVFSIAFVLCLFQFPVLMYAALGLIVVSPLAIHSGWNKLMDIIDREKFKAVCDELQQASDIQEFPRVQDLHDVQTRQECVDSFA